MAKLAAADLAPWAGPVTLTPGVAVDARVRAGGVWLTARTQEAMFLLTGADSSARAQAVPLNGLAAAVADSLLHGGAHGLDSTFSPSLVEAGRPEFFRFWKMEADSIGGAARVEVLGTIVSSPFAARTLVRLEGARGHRVLTLDWAAEKLIQSVPVGSDGLTLRFEAESRDRLSRYDLRCGRFVRVARGCRRRAARGSAAAGWRAWRRSPSRGASGSVCSVSL